MTGVQTCALPISPASPWSLLFGWLENLSKKTHVDYHAASVPLLRSLFFFLVFATCLVLGVWVVSKCGKGKEIYIFSYFGMFSDYIRDFEVFFFVCLVFGC